MGFFFLFLFFYFACGGYFILVKRLYNMLFLVVSYGLGTGCALVLGVHPDSLAILFLGTLVLTTNGIIS
jgi:hypothetical protein